jgi:hypothetical protein
MENLNYNFVEDFNTFIKCGNDDDRFYWIKNTLKENHIPFEEQNFDIYTNIICKGSSTIWASAHFDTIDIKHCANDNSASIINLIHLKKILPELNVVFLDAEEPPMMGKGSESFSRYVKEHNIGCSFVLNLELTGYGNCICLGSRGGESKKRLEKSLDNFPDFYLSEVDTPFSDTDIFLRNGLDSTLIMLLPMKNNRLMEECMYHCHTSKDTYDKMDFDIMNRFVNKLSLVLSKEME